MNCQQQQHQILDFYYLIYNFSSKQPDLLSRSSFFSSSVVALVAHFFVFAIDDCICNFFFYLSLTSKDFNSSSFVVIHCWFSLLCVYMSVCCMRVSVCVCTRVQIVICQVLLHFASPYLVRKKKQLSLVLMCCTICQSKTNEKLIKIRRKRRLVLHTREGLSERVDMNESEDEEVRPRMAILFFLLFLLLMFLLLHCIPSFFFCASFCVAAV